MQNIEDLGKPSYLKNCLLLVVHHSGTGHARTREYIIETLTIALNKTRVNYHSKCFYLVIGYASVSLYL